MGYILFMNDKLPTTDLNLLTSLLAIIEERSVTGAADQVGLSQPAMSHILKRLRILLDDEILVREGNQNSLTPRAQALEVPLRGLLSRTAEVLWGEPFNPATSARIVTIVMSPSVAYIVGPALSQILETQAPSLELRIIATGKVHEFDFRTTSADLVLLPEGYYTDLPRERLFDDEWAVVSGDSQLSPDNALEKLETLPHISVASERVPRPYEHLNALGIRPKILARVDDYMLIPPLIEGQGRIGFHRRKVIESLSIGRDLYYVAAPIEIIGLGVDIVWNPWLGDELYQDWLRAALEQTTHML